MSTNTVRRRVSSAEQVEGKLLEHFSDVKVGRVSFVQPLRGRLERYVKPDGKQGCSVRCEDSFMRYGVTFSVQRFFPELGTYKGWAFLDEQRRIVFRFIQADPPEVVKPATVIHCGEENIVARASDTKFVTLREGGYVAVYVIPGAKSVPHRKQEATYVLPLDSSPLLVARLLTAGKLQFPAHTKLVDLFLAALPAIGARVAGHRELLLEALTALGNCEALPSNLRMLARVERSRLDSGKADINLRTNQQNVARTKPDPSSSEETDGTRCPTVALDIERVKLDLE